MAPRRLSVPKPTGLAAAGADSLFVISEGAVHKLSLADGRLALFAKDRLDQPQAIAAGPDGTVYVSSRGKPHNVSVFAKDGSYQRCIGKAGGRAMATPPPADKGNPGPSRAGKWDPDTLLNPAGLALDAKGRLWVAEHDFSPKRVSVRDPARGKLADEKFGPCYVSMPVCMDSADPTRVYCQNVEWEVDLDRGTWRPAAVMFDARPDTPYFWPHMVNNIVFTARSGKQYMTAKTADGLVRGDFLWVRRGDHFEAAAGVISPWAGLTWRKAPKDWQEYTKVPWLFWEDRNGDGVIQPEGEGRAEDASGARSPLRLDVAHAAYAACQPAESRLEGSVQTLRGVGDRALAVRIRALLGGLINLPEPFRRERRCSRQGSRRARRLWPPGNPL